MLMGLECSLTRASPGHSRLPILSHSTLKVIFSKDPLPVPTASLRALPARLTQQTRLTLGFRDGHFPSGGPGLLMQTRALPPENDLLEEAPDRELGSTTENTLSFPQAADA